MTTEAAQTAPTIEELERLLVNNEVLAKIELYLNRFNPIRVMRMERMEIRHSAILAWLLDPKESHGLDDKFLKAFLGEALRGQNALGFPTAIDVARAEEARKRALALMAEKTLGEEEYAETLAALERSLARTRTASRKKYKDVGRTN